MITYQSILGLPWQLAKHRLTLANINYIAEYGESFNKFFAVADKGWYVARIREKNDTWHVLLYRPMVYSDFETMTGVAYAEEIIREEEG